MVCNACHQDFPEDFFYPRKSRSKKENSSKVIRLTKCKFCTRKYTLSKKLEYQGKTPTEISFILAEILYGENNPSLRKCRWCDTWKSEENFTMINAKGSSRKTTNRCNDCERKRKHDWALVNIDKQKIANSIWKKQNPEKLAIYSHNRRITKGKIGVTSSQIKKLKLYYCETGKCMDCGENKKLTIDHVIPLKLGGDNLITNLQFLCQSCNSKKGIAIKDFRPDNGDYAQEISNGL